MVADQHFRVLRALESGSGGFVYLATMISYTQIAKCDDESEEIKCFGSGGQIEESYLNCKDDSFFESCSQEPLTHCVLKIFSGSKDIQKSFL